ncbi:sodium- and chloride-dependent taurine transporter-like [Pecten maximus]|uniref:sodium- and chloride-dependent taurine transporter-like n=1 Tax=Pecten maximus TaxID=6579 RepID=UPI0014590952|nr:sodium- and chloride-dependent taurine transporter-like [Pecten maximus]
MANSKNETSELALLSNLSCIEDSNEVGVEKGNATRTADIKDNLRGTWSRKCDFILSCVGLAVGLGNIWRFPYLCYKNGGGAFLIPYGTFLVFGGIPLFMLEIALGQYMSLSGHHAWNICPVFQGIGISNVVTCFFMNMYYILVLAWSAYYLGLSITSVLPWSHCNNTWNTQSCSIEQEKRNFTNAVGSCSNSTCDPNWMKPVDPAVEFWERKVLQMTADITDGGGIIWELALSLLVVWVLIYFCVWKGVKWTGKVVYFTATFPYVILLVLLVRGLSLDGASDGLVFYLKPDISRLADIQVWIDGGTQVFFSYAVAIGATITLGSYNKFSNNFYKYFVGENYPENPLGQSFSGSRGTHLYNSVVVFSAPINGISTKLHTSSNKTKSISANKPGKAIPSKNDEVGAFKLSGKTLSGRGLLEDASDIILSAWRQSTQKQYGSYINSWMLFCNERSCSPLTASAEDCFLIACINTGTSLVGGLAVFSVLGFMAKQHNTPISEVADAGPGLVFVVYPKAVTQMSISPLWSVLFFFMVILIGMDSQFVAVESVITPIVDYFPKYLQRQNPRMLFVAVYCCVSYLVGLSMVSRGGMYIFQLFDYYSASGMVLLWTSFLETVAISWVFGVDRFYDAIEMMIGYRISPYLRICWKYLTPLLSLGLFVTEAVLFRPLTYNTTYQYPGWAQALGVMLAVSAMLCVPVYGIAKLTIASGPLTERWHVVTTPILKKHQLHPNWTACNRKGELENPELS